MHDLGLMLIDEKVRGISVSLTMTIGDYFSIAKDIMKKNEYQRKKVRKRYNVYALLQEDLLSGCIMPSLVLATDENFRTEFNTEIKKIDKIIDRGSTIDSDKDYINSLLEKVLKSDYLLILDGIQRTATIEKALQEAESEEKEMLLKHKIRVELYLGLTKYGILYRMLTLNTGQTPMTFRHQLEILFNDYLGKDRIEDVELFRETDSGYKREPGKYRFSDVVDLYQAYMLGTPHSLDKKRLLEEIKELEFLESYERKKSPDMRSLIKAYNKFVVYLTENAKDWEWDEESASEVSKPFGKNIPAFFIRPQAMSGFGSACSWLIENKTYKNITLITNLLKKSLDFDKESIREGMNNFVEFMHEIQEKSTRYGPDQRILFEEFFKILLSSMDNHDFNKCVVEAYEKF